jgi:hypothetical protein
MLPGTRLDGIFGSQYLLFSEVGAKYAMILR